MKKAVYDFIAQNPNTTIRKCASALQIEDLAVMAWIHELRNEGCVKSMILPLGNDIDPDSSTFYSVCKAYRVKEDALQLEDPSDSDRQSSMGKPDILGNMVSVGDTIMLIAQDGRYLTTEVVNSCGETRCYFTNRADFAYQDSYRPYNGVFSVTALGDAAENIEQAGVGKRDALGNPVDIGDVVLIIETGYRRFQKGKALSVAGKSCMVSFEPDCYFKTSGRRFYRDIVSLSKIGLENIQLPENE